MERISKTKLEKYATLLTKKGRRKEKCFIVQGEKAIKDMMPYFDLVQFIVSTSFEGSSESQTDGKTVSATPSEMKKISTLNDLPEMIAVFRIPESSPCITIEDRSNFYLALDDVRDPGNFGTIIRTAHWFGIPVIYCSKESPDIYNPKVVQATMGSLGRIRVEYCDLRQLFNENEGFPVYGLELRGRDIFKETGFEPGFILMGNEGHGISDGLRECITDSLLIPPADSHNHPESLNVAIATAITLSILKK